MIGTEGDLVGKEAQGIIKWTNELLTICYTMPGKARPTSFESISGSGAQKILAFLRHSSVASKHRLKSYVLAFSIVGTAVRFPEVGDAQCEMRR